jgi:hypothetical protein
MWIKLTKSTLVFPVSSRENDVTNVPFRGIGSWAESVLEHSVEVTEVILMGPWLAGKYMQTK